MAFAWNGRMHPKIGVGVNADDVLARSSISAAERGAAIALVAKARDTIADVNFMVEVFSVVDCK